MVLQPGHLAVRVIAPLESPRARYRSSVPAVRQAPLKNHQGWSWSCPVKSSWTEDCACTVNGAARTASAASALRKVLRFITNHLC